MAVPVAVAVTVPVPVPVPVPVSVSLEEYISRSWTDLDSLCKVHTSVYISSALRNSFD